MEPAISVGLTAGTALAGEWGLARDRLRVIDVNSGLRGADGEEVILPAFAACGLFPQFGSAGGNAAWKRDILEHGVLLGDRNVNLLVRGLRLRLLLLPHHLPLDSLGVASVDILRVLRVGVPLQFSLDALLFLVDAPCPGVKLLKGLADLLLDNAGDCWLHEPEEDGFEHGEQRLVLRLFNLDPHVGEANVHAVYFEEIGTVVLVGSGQGKLEGKAFAAEEDVNDTSVFDLREALLAVDVVAYIYNFVSICFYFFLRRERGRTYLANRTESAPR